VNLEFFFFFYGSVSAEIHRMAIEKIFAAICSPLDACDFHAELSDDYEVAMTNFAGTRPSPRVTIRILTIIGTNQIAQPSELFINNTCVKTQRTRTQSRTHIHTHTHLLYMMNYYARTHTRRYFHVYRIVWQKFYFLSRKKSGIVLLSD